MISLMRDTYVQIPGYSDQKLNAAYKYGGFPLLYETVKLNFGLTINGGFEVDFDAFKTIVDLVGGVEITLTEAEAREMIRMSQNTLSASAGRQPLDGTRALLYARMRMIDSDYARTNRQRTILMSVYNKVKGTGVSNLNNLLNTILPYLKTDMSNGQIMSLAGSLIPRFGSLSISTYTIPAYGQFANHMIDGMAVWTHEKSVTRQKLLEILPF